MLGGWAMHIIMWIGSTVIGVSTSIMGYGWLVDGEFNIENMLINIGAVTVWISIVLICTITIDGIKLYRRRLKNIKENKEMAS